MVHFEIDSIHFKLHVCFFSVSFDEIVFKIFLDVVDKHLILIHLLDKFLIKSFWFLIEEFSKLSEFSFLFLFKFSHCGFNFFDNWHVCLKLMEVRFIIVGWDLRRGVVDILSVLIRVSLTLMVFNLNLLLSEELWLRMVIKLTTLFSWLMIAWILRVWIWIHPYWIILGMFWRIFGWVFYSCFKLICLIASDLKLLDDTVAMFWWFWFIIFLWFFLNFMLFLFFFMLKSNKWTLLNFKIVKMYFFLKFLFFLRRMFSWS